MVLEVDSGGILTNLPRVPQLDFGDPATYEIALSEILLHTLIWSSNYKLLSCTT